MDGLLRELDSQIPHKDSVYEYYVDPKKRAWAHWEERLSASFRVNTESMPFYRHSLSKR